MILYMHLYTLGLYTKSNKERFPAVLKGNHQFGTLKCVNRYW